MNLKRHIQRILISLFVFLGLSACTLSTTKNLIETKVTSKTYTNSYFSDSIKDYVYKAKIEVYGHHLGGLMIIKKIANEHYRIVFATEFGSRILDLEFVKNNFKTNFVLDELNKKIIVNTLKKDFKLLLKEKHLIEKMYTNDDAIVYQSRANKRTNFFFVSEDNHQLKKIVNTSKTKEKVMITFSQIEKALAKKISIVHKNIKLRIDLKYLDTN